MTLKEKLMNIQNQIKVPKNKKNDFGNFKYRSAEDILKAFKKYEIEYKVLLTMDDDVIAVGNSNYIVGMAVLEDLESDEKIIKKAFAKEPEQAKAKMDESQTTGSASSYARKYALNGLLLLDDSIDFDSNAAVDSGAPASVAQVKMIENLCKKHNVNQSELYKKHKVKDVPTAAQAGAILNIFKKHFGDE